MAKVYKTTGRKRQSRVIQADLASEAIGPLEPGCEIFGLTMGQFSLIELIEACLEETGPADVIVATWTAADADTRHAHRMLESGKLRSLRFLVDFSFRSRQPEFCRSLLKRFGPSSLRITNIHAKFVTIRNERRNLAIRTSMNLNQNKRLEDFEISDDAGLAGMLQDFVDSVYSDQSEHEMMTAHPGQHKRQLERGLGAIKANSSEDIGLPAGYAEI